MNWSKRLQCLMQEAQRTNGFTHNNYVSKLYYKLLNAVNKQEAETAKKLIVQMGF